MLPLVLFRAASPTLPGAGAAEVVRIGTLPGLRFDVSAFSVRPGSNVELIFSNRDEMLHNLVITSPGARLEVVNAALALGAGAAEVHFVPDMPEVLWATKVVPSGQSETLRFTALASLGEYPFVCTYPGHRFVMFGTMFVTNTLQVPVMTAEQEPPPEATAHHAVAPDPGVVVTRGFMPDAAGPASIAVGLPGGYAYCWDAGACGFRYAWQGGYLDRGERGVANLHGEVFYRETVENPLHTGSDPTRTPARIRFLGYRLSPEGYPEFRYVVDGLEIGERILVQDRTVVRRFRTNASSANATVWFEVPAESGARFSATGPREGAFFKFTGNSARAFAIVIEAGGEVRP